ncbi:FecR family protein [Pedobacter nyackensis]|uniref:FecR family protein n=1 Tax=Pedobacter nyackensis TaxID=475255 RepID=A0A1W2DL87_9SPHI|nr:FecR domain-containing protein [Pedobacter nyackensis]SMC98193.1 FecR family protein [Pedobacter nyackensis]
MNNDLKNLIKKNSEGKCTDEEQAKLQRWFHNFNADQPTDLTEEDHHDASHKIWSAVSFQSALPSNLIHKPRSYPFVKVVTMAAAVAAVVFGLFFLLKKDNSAVENYANDVKPGSNQATLTLADGKTINLAEAKNGQLAKDRNVEIIKMADGQLQFRFNADDISKPTRVKNEGALNLMVTPKGGQYSISLPDGTNVWVNAGSKIRFPSNFENLSERRVYLSGEAYFEVKPMRAVYGDQRGPRPVPFKVITDKQELTVLGTHFNINSYDDESYTKTTLLEGSVKVSAKGGYAILKPGQQSVTNGSAFELSAADIEEAVAWKNGEFMFAKEELGGIMKKISRWYNVEVVYADPQLENKVFNGTISKFKNVSRVLKMLEATGEVKFRIEGRRVTVMR